MSTISHKKNQASPITSLEKSPIQKFAVGAGVGAGLRVAVLMAGKGPVRWKDVGMHGLMLGYGYSFSSSS